MSEEWVRCPAVTDTDEWLSHGNASGDTSANDVASVIREYREAAGQNQTQVASALEITQQNLSQMEHGRRPVSMELRRMLVDTLSIPPENLGLSQRGPRPTVASDHTSPDIAASRGRWRAQRNWLNCNRAALAKLAVQEYPPDWRVGPSPLIAPPPWIPSEPLELPSLQLALSEQPQTVALTGKENATASTRPLRTPDVRFDCYTSAVKHLDAPTLFESRPSYRLLDVDLAHKRLDFGLAAYFDKLDVSEALGHEMALACMDRSIPEAPEDLADKLPFRQLVGDPFDPSRRAIIPAITTLTIRLRRYPAEPSFLLHWRDPGKVATAAGIYDVIPAGEFQPSSVALWDRRNDFDLWRNMVREYSEELLGTPEHDGTRTEAIDYTNWQLYQTLEQAQERGTVRPFVLGIGVDALTLAATILTVVVIDDDVFETLFGTTVHFNEEGEIVGIGDGRQAEGVPFEKHSVDRMLTSEPLASPGAACLSLAWQHREHLLG